MLSRRWFMVLAGSAAVLLSDAIDAAEAARNPDEFIRELGGELLNMLSNKNLAPVQKEAEFRRLFVRGVDLDLISRFVLGRYWREASENEKSEYRDLFEAFVVKSYLHRLSGYSGETFAVKETKAIDERDALVMTLIERGSGQPPLRVDWRLRKGEQAYRIVDVMVEGISMVVTQREEFTAVIQKNGGKIGELNNLLRERILSLN